MRRAVLFSMIVMVGAVICQAQETKRPIYYYNPDWSPDGSKILFESTREGEYAIYTIRADGSDLRRISSGETNDEQPRWSRDGRQIVFISDRDGRLQLYLMNADGSNERRLTNSADDDYQPSFSPKGDRVTFVSRPKQPVTNHDIYVIRTDGTERKRLTDLDANYGSPGWSPDGKKILFVRGALLTKSYREMSTEDRAQMQKSQEIFIMNADGSSLRNLTNNTVRDSSPSWSPDGKTIHFLSERDGALHIYAMNADGSNARKIADGSFVTTSITSRRTDGALAYTKQANGKWGLYIYDLKSGKKRLVIGG